MPHPFYRQSPPLWGRPSAANPISTHDIHLSEFHWSTLSPILSSDPPAVCRFRQASSVDTSCLLFPFYAQHHPLTPHHSSSVPTGYTDDSAGITKIVLRRLNATGEQSEGTVLLNLHGPGVRGTRIVALKYATIQEKPRLLLGLILEESGKSSKVAECSTIHQILTQKTHSPPPWTSSQIFCQSDGLPGLSEDHNLGQEC